MSMALVPFSAMTAPQKALTRNTLKNSLYPGAADASVDLVLAYCEAAGLDVMQKPVHIVAIWDSQAGVMRDVIMPGVGLYRTQAARSGECAGLSEPVFGPMVKDKIGGVEIEFPEWCRVTARRLMRNGEVADFTAVEYWRENYGMKGGRAKDIAPNAMWRRRPRGQVAKCAEAQAWRKAFPEIGSAPTAEEMEGQTLYAEFSEVTNPAGGVAMPQPKKTATPSPADSNTSSAETAGEPEGSSAPAGAEAASAGQDASAAGGGFGDLSAGQIKIVRAKAKAAGLVDDAAIFAAMPSFSKATINSALSILTAKAAE